MKPDQRPINYATFMATVMSQVGCVVVLLIGLAMGAGLLLDRFLDTDRLFTVIFLLGSVPVTLYIIMRLSLNAAARAQQLIEANQTEEKTEA